MGGSRGWVGAEGARDPQGLGWAPGGRQHHGQGPDSARSAPRSPGRGRRLRRAPGAEQQVAQPGAGGRQPAALCSPARPGGARIAARGRSFPGARSPAQPGRGARPTAGMRGRLPAPSPGLLPAAAKGSGLGCPGSFGSALGHSRPHGPGGAGEGCEHRPPSLRNKAQGGEQGRVIRARSQTGLHL